MVTSLLLQPNDYSGILLRLLDGLSNSEQKIVLYCILKFLSNNRFTSTVTSDFSAQWWSRDAETISAAAGLIALVTAGEESRRSCLISWSSSPSGAGVGDGIEIRRAVLAALVGSNEDMETVFEKSLQQCGDPLYIRHTPTLQQEGISLSGVSFVMASILLRNSSHADSPPGSRICPSKQAPSFHKDH